jgi:NAD(P)-dependent dehydrogenase (short-subunit alcohol dehydrogenase family)
MNLQGKVALVTGGAQRVGRAISTALGGAGADVVINYKQSQTEAETLLAELEQAGRRATSFRADVSQPSEIGDLIAHVRERFGRLDILINNASVFERSPLLEITEAMWDRVLGINLKAPFFVSQAAVPLMRANGGGTIINIADLSAFQPWPSYAHHSVSKAGLVHLTKIMARALAPEIRVNGIAPGTVLPPADYDGTAGDGTLDRRVLARPGTPDDVIHAVFYLLEGNFVTGQTVIVDGGRMLL